MVENWYAVYTKPRWEKKVAIDLTKVSIESYCPINNVMRYWSDRKKIVQEPLLPSYVFVKLTENQFDEVKKVHGVLNLVYWLGRPAKIPESEIESIRSFLTKNKNVQLEKISINDQVKITEGSLINQRGTIVDIKNNSLKVALPTLGYILYVEVEKSSVIKS